MSTSEPPPSPVLLPDPSTMKVGAMKRELESYGTVPRGTVFVERSEMEYALLKARREQQLAQQSKSKLQSDRKERPRPPPSTGPSPKTSKPVAEAATSKKLCSPPVVSNTAPASAPKDSAKSKSSVNNDHHAKSPSSLSIKQLKSELRSYSISTDSFFDKSCLIEAVVQARAEGWCVPTERFVPVDDGGKNNYSRAPFASSSSTSSSSTASAATAAASFNNRTNGSENTDVNTDPLGPLHDGQSIQVRGSGASIYTIRRDGNQYVCGCPGWKYQNAKGGEERICKHIRELRGLEEEDGGGGGKKKRASSSSAGQGKKKKTKKSTNDAGGDGADEDGGASCLPIEPALAKSYPQNGTDDDVKGWYMSEKLDGMRCVWDGTRHLWSRNGNTIHAPSFFIDALPLGTVLDGELFLGRGEFNDCMSITRSHGKNEAGWRKITYMIFDAPQVSEDFGTRIDCARTALIGCACPESIAKVLPQTICRSRAHVTEELERITADNGEGIMLRHPAALYKGGRVGELLKVKKFIDAEAVVLSHEDGKGRHQGRMGAIVCRMVGDATSSKTFKIGTGFSDDERNNPPAVGCTVTYKYFELTKAGIPRFPVFVRIRPSE